MKPMEKASVAIFADDKQASCRVAGIIADLIHQRAAAGKKAVLGLATGHTPVNVYRELIRLHREQGLDFSNVITFNLDEYWPIRPERLQSYHTWMHENLFNHINIPAGQVHIPRGDIDEKDIPAFCREYERKIAEAGGIDLQILGIGRSGHVGFNEPGSDRDSLTRCIRLDAITRKDAASDFFGEENVPEMAITMGVGSILAARQICLLAFGEHKAPIIQRAVEGEISTSVAASFLQEHPNARFYLDQAAAAQLTRMKTPWKVGSCEWDEPLRRQAVMWLARQAKKPILKLTDEDYAENGLEELLRLRHGAYHLNIEVFRRQMNTITGWPGGKDGPKRVLIFSPHPDDDVICMGGTLRRLVEQGHTVHVAYMVSGYLSVFDHDVARHADFVRQFSRIFNIAPSEMEVIDNHIEQFLHGKTTGDIDTPEVQAIKGLIRRTEALDAARACGLGPEHVHFLDLPFYNTGKVQKLNLGEKDIAAVRSIIETVRPDMIFAAGDLSDPHGTHRLCLEAILAVMKQLFDGKKETAQDRGQDARDTVAPVLWLYRGAWQEWEPQQIDMAVPLSPDELRQKRYAIFRHESQKDRAMFPGPYDSREFWQRAEDRNTATAQLYDALGLPEYHALEAFAKYPLPQSAAMIRQLEQR